MKAGRHRSRCCQYFEGGEDGGRQLAEYLAKVEEQRVQLGQRTDRSTPVCRGSCAEIRSCFRAFQGRAGRAAGADRKIVTNIVRNNKGKSSAGRRVAGAVRGPRRTLSLPGCLASAAADGEAPPLAPWLALSLVQLEPILAGLSRRAPSLLVYTKKHGKPLDFAL
ncbi:MAG: hypothetical protein ACLVC5_09160 [Clostridia bacterium]